MKGPRLPPMMPIEPPRWSQPVHTRQATRYVYSEKELRKAIADSVSAPSVSWVLADADIIAETSTFMTIVIAAGITVTSTIEIPATANGLKITQTGGAFLQPSAGMAGGVCFSVSSTVVSGKTALGFLVWFDGIVVKWTAGDDNSGFATAIELGSSVYSTRITNCYLYGNISAALAQRTFMSGCTLPDGAVCKFGANTFLSNCQIGHSVEFNGKALIAGCELENVTVNAGATDVVLSGCIIRNWTDTASNGGNLVTGCLISGTVTAHMSSSVDNPGGTRVTNNNFA